MSRKDYQEIVNDLVPDDQLPPVEAVKEAAVMPEEDPSASFAMRKQAAYKEAAEKFKSWDEENVRKHWHSLGGSESACAEKMQGKVTDADAYCSALADRARGTTSWRGKKKD